MVLIENANMPLSKKYGINMKYLQNLLYFYKKYKLCIR